VLASLRSPHLGLVRWRTKLPWTSADELCWNAVVSRSVDLDLPIGTTFLRATTCQERVSTVIDMELEFQMSATLMDITAPAGTSLQPCRGDLERLASG